MAELLATNGWYEAGSIGATLHDTLSDDYVVVEHPTVHGRTMDAVVVGPQGLFVLQSKAWTGEIRPAPQGDWQVRLATGQQGSYPNPTVEAQRDTTALRAFLHDEFPAFTPEIHHLLVLANPDARLVGSVPQTEPLVTRPDTLPAAIVAVPTPANGAFLTPDQREALGVALRDRQLTASQRAGKPFVFRSGNLLGSGKKVWTVRDAVAHMDRHPQDGIYHLNNGTLARWLDEEGAVHLAELARQVMRTRETDPRVPLENFLIGTGLVARPRLSVRPQPVNLGCVVAGRTCGARLQIGKGPGRGYLFGTLQSSEPWLRVEPHGFSGRSLEALVSADTSALPISSEPWQADILVHSSASDDPVAIPVRVRVMGEPSSLNRYGVRPLIGILAAGAIGALIGLLLGASGALGKPARWSDALSPALFWALAIGLVWAAFGAVRGLSQRSAWTVGYATARFLLRVGLWIAGLVVAATIGLLLWNGLSGHPGPPVLSIGGLRLILLAASLAIVPATLSEIRAARLPGDTPIGSNRRRLLQPALWALAVLGLVAVLATGARLAEPVRRQLETSGMVDTTQGWIEQRWAELETTVDKVIDQVYLWRYDRRAKPEQ